MEEGSSYPLARIVASRGYLGEYRRACFHFRLKEFMFGGPIQKMNCYKTDMFSTNRKLNYNKLQNKTQALSLHPNQNSQLSLSVSTGVVATAAFVLRLDCWWWWCCVSALSRWCCCYASLSGCSYNKIQAYMLRIDTGSLVLFFYLGKF